MQQADILKLLQNGTLTYHNSFQHHHPLPDNERAVDGRIPPCHRSKTGAISPLQGHKLATAYGQAVWIYPSHELQSHIPRQGRIVQCRGKGVEVLRNGADELDHRQGQEYRAHGRIGGKGQATGGIRTVAPTVPDGKPAGCRRNGSQCEFRPVEKGRTTTAAAAGTGNGPIVLGITRDAPLTRDGDGQLVTGRLHRDIKI